MIESLPDHTTAELAKIASYPGTVRLDTEVIASAYLLFWTPLDGSRGRQAVIRTYNFVRFQDACKRALEANRLPRPAAVLAPVPERQEARAAYRIAQAIEKPRRRRPAQRQKESPEERRAAYLAEKSAM